MRIIHLTALDDPDIKPDIQRLADDADPLVAGRGRMLLGSVNHLEAHGPAPGAFGHPVGDELWLSPVNRHNRTRVHVRVDGPDYSPVHDGLPEMYYRSNISRGGPHLSRDERTADVSEVERSIWEAFGWASPSTGDPA